MISLSTFACFVTLLTTNILSTDDVFHAGPVIDTFGNIADVDSDVEMSPATELKIRFDVGKGSQPTVINTTFDSAARFINVNVAAGVLRKNIKIAIVVHGSAALDVTKNAFYAIKKNEPNNPSATAIKLLQDNQVDFYLCGQSAAYHQIKKTDLLNGVMLAPSAMTIHALLAKRQYSLNPF